MSDKAQPRRHNHPQLLSSRLALFALLLSAGASLATTGDEPWSDEEDEDWLEMEGEPEDWWFAEDRILGAEFSLTADDGPRRSFLMTVDLTFGSAIMISTEHSQALVELELQNTGSLASGQGSSIRISRTNSFSEDADGEQLVEIVGLARGEERNDIRYEINMDAEHCEGTASCVLQHRVVLEHLGGGDVEGQWAVGVQMEGGSEGWTSPDTRIRVTEE